MVVAEVFSGEVPFDAQEFRHLPLEDFVARLVAVPQQARPYLPRPFSQLGWLTDLVSAFTGFR